MYSEIVTIIALLCSIIGCVIGVAGFVCGLIGRARKDGMMMEKIDQCVKGIDEMKGDIKEQGKKHSENEKLLAAHSEQIHTIFVDLTGLKERMDRYDIK